MALAPAVPNDMMQAKFVNPIASDSDDELQTAEGDGAPLACKDQDGAEEASSVASVLLDNLQRPNRHAASSLTASEQLRAQSIFREVEFGALDVGVGSLSEEEEKLLEQRKQRCECYLHTSVYTRPHR